MNFYKRNANIVNEKIAKHEDITEGWEFEPIQKEDLDYYITGAIGIFCVTYPDRVEMGYFSGRHNECYIIRAHSDFTFSIAGWIVEEGEKDD